MDFDKLTFDILRKFNKETPSIKEIADDLCVAQNTVRSRINALREQGILSFPGLMDGDKIPGHMVVTFAVCTRNTDLVGSAEEFSRLKGVISVSIVTGRYDLLVVALLSKDGGLEKFVTEEIVKVSDVISTEAFVAYNTIGVKVPYVL